MVLGLAIAGAGCEAPVADEGPPDYAKVNVPVKGKVTVDGKPLAGVVVTFIPPSFGPSNGETKEDGTYELKSATFPGAPPGTYKVAISHIVGDDGVVYGLGPRSSMSPPAGLSVAQEKLPPEVADPGRTKLTANVPAGPFDFDIKSAEPAKAEAKK